MPGEPRNVTPGPHATGVGGGGCGAGRPRDCLLYTSDAADERSSVDLGGRRIIKKQNTPSRRDTGVSNIHRTVSASSRADYKKSEA